MPQLNTFLRKHLVRPFKKYAKAQGKELGPVINELIEEKLKQEGYLAKGKRA